MNSLNLIEMEKQKRALRFISALEDTENKDEKIKLFVDMMTYYDGNNCSQLSIVLYGYINRFIYI